MFAIRVARSNYEKLLPDCFGSEANMLHGKESDTVNGCTSPGSIDIYQTDARSAQHSLAIESSTVNRSNEIKPSIPLTNLASGEIKGAKNLGVGIYPCVFVLLWPCAMKFFAMVQRSGVI